jgi:hypothetical protein
MIHVYAFALDVETLDGVVGLAGAVPECVQVDGVSVIVGRMDTAEDTTEAVVLHGFVVNALAERSAAVLPARFGERFADVEALRTAVRGLAGLRSQLERVRDCVELGVRIGVASAPSADAPDASEYIRARAAETARLADAGARLERDLRGITEDALVQTIGGRGEVRRAAFLVRRSATGEFVAAVRAFTEQNSDVDVLCTGPWPPYSFAGAAA